MVAICDEFEAYGYRRVGAALRHQGVVVNGKKICRLMRAHDLQPRRRRRFIATTNSDHNGPIFPDRAKGMVVDGPNQLWVADLTCIAIATGFVYLAAILTPGHAGWSGMRSSSSPWVLLGFVIHLQAAPQQFPAILCLAAAACVARQSSSMERKEERRSCRHSLAVTRTSPSPPRSRPGERHSGVS
jgi:hypothetical protein